MYCLGFRLSQCTRRAIYCLSSDWKELEVVRSRPENDVGTKPFSYGVPGDLSSTRVEQSPRIRQGFANGRFEDESASKGEKQREERSSGRVNETFSMAIHKKLPCGSEGKIRNQVHHRPRSRAHCLDAVTEIDYRGYLLVSPSSSASLLEISLFQANSFS